MLWADAVWIHDGFMYVTTNQLNRMASLNAGEDKRERPYALFRIAIDANR